MLPPPRSCEADAPAGPGWRDWDGTDDRGARLASGVYLVQVDGGGRSVRKKISLVR